jgi:methyl-accepting chemotaxis protein
MIASKPGEMNKSYKFLDPAYTFKLRKRAILTISLLALLGNISSVGLVIIGITGRFDPVRNSGSIAIVSVSILAIILALFDRVATAATLFCLVAVGAISLAVNHNGIISPSAILYFLVIIVSGLLISPIAEIVFGLLSAGSYLGVAIYLISNTPNPPASYGSNVALVTAVLIITSSVLFLFTNNLNRIASSARSQAEELEKANRLLMSRRELELETTHQVGQLSETLGELFSKQSTANEEQVELISEVASTTQELDAAARRIANNALSVSTMAEKALKSAEAGQHAALDGVDAIGSLRTRVENIAQSVRYLNNQIERISEVSDIIGDIADETNLLALNATIEAAGAREYGKRFAAVAEEIQRLSRRTSAAVEQIQEVISEIIQASEKSLFATEEGMLQAKEGETLVQRLIAANNEIINMVNQTADLATSIATSTQQQRTASEQIVSNVQRISISSTGLVQFSAQVSQIIANLEAGTARLVETAEEYPIEDETPSNSDLLEELDREELKIIESLNESLTASTPRSQ